MILRLASVLILAVCAFWQGLRGQAIHTKTSALADLLPDLRGQRAVEHLKQAGLYDTLVEAAPSARYNADGLPSIDSPFTQQAKLLASNGAASHNFGRTAAISGNTVVVGSAGGGGPSGTQGAVYVFVRNGTTWDQQAILTAPDTGFGESVAIDGDTVVAVAGGVAYVFTRAGSTWSQQAKLTTSDGPVLTGSVIIDANTVVAGATGLAYVFARTGSTWSQQAKLTASDGAVLSGPVAIDTDTAIVGAAGAAYVFFRASATWSQQAKLTAPANGFGNSVAIDADTVVVGAIFADGGFGAAFIFTRSDGMWTQQQKLVPGGFIGEFGAQVAIDGTTVLVVSPAQPIIFLTTTADPNQFRGGVVYVFIRSGEIWTEQQVFSAGADPEDFFGNSVAIDADTVVVGAPFTDIDSKLDQGAAYVFTRVECQTITISPAALPDAVAFIPYNQTLTASGGIGPITFSLAAGALPAGLSIDPAGSISGTPAGPGTFNFTVRATDAVGCTEMNAYTVKTAFSGFVTVSAASYTSPVASKEIVAGFGVILPLPTSLAGARVIVKDSAGIERVAPLYFISPSQINYQIPDGTALGPASISAFNDNLLLALGSVQIVATAPSVFALNASGFGPAAALDALTFLPAPFNAELADGAPNFIAVWGTGLGADATDGGDNVFASVTALIDGEEAQVTYAGLAPGFQGANQFNIQLPLGITSGAHTLTISRGAVTSNVVMIEIK